MCRYVCACVHGVCNGQLCYSAALNKTAVVNIFKSHYVDIHSLQFNSGISQTSAQSHRPLPSQCTRIFINETRYNRANWKDQILYIISIMFIFGGIYRMSQCFSSINHKMYSVSPPWASSGTQTVSMKLTGTLSIMHDNAYT